MNPFSIEQAAALMVFHIQNGEIEQAKFYDSLIADWRCAHGIFFQLPLF